MEGGTRYCIHSCKIPNSFSKLTLKIAIFSCLSDWYTDNRLSLNVKNTKMMLVGSKTTQTRFKDFYFSLSGEQIDRAQSFKIIWSYTGPEIELESTHNKLGPRLSVFNRLFTMFRMKELAMLMLMPWCFHHGLWRPRWFKFRNAQLQALQNNFATKIHSS